MQTPGAAPNPAASDAAGAHVAFELETTARPQNSTQHPHRLGVFTVDVHAISSTITSSSNAISSTITSSSSRLKRGLSSQLDRVVATLDEDGDGTVTAKEVAHVVKRFALSNLGLFAAILRGRLRRMLRRHEIAAASISILYLVFIFCQLLIEEMPLKKKTLEDFLDVALLVDVTFLSWFVLEIAAYTLVEGLGYFRDSKMNCIDASTVLISMVITCLNLTGVLDTRLEMFRIFRLLRLVKVAIAVQRVRARTNKWRRLDMEIMYGPPQCNWSKAKRYGAAGEAAPKTYAAFLSHFKLEAGADARYLEQEMEAMLRADVFIDCNDMTDIGAVFRDGVHQSEVLILLGTSHVLTRPACLLELYEARLHGIPVLTLAMSAHSFTPAKARTQLQQLTSTLSPPELATIHTHLATTGASFERFLALVTEAVDPPSPNQTGYHANEEPGPPLFQEWHNNNMAIDSLVRAEIQALISSMALVTGRSIKWSDADPLADDLGYEASAGPQSCMDRLRCRRTGPKHVYICFADGAVSPARVLQNGLRVVMGQPVTLSSDWTQLYQQLRRIDHAHPEAEQRALGERATEQLEEAIDEGVGNAMAVIVLLTRELLQCPFTLLQVYEALTAGVKVVPVIVDGFGFSFEDAQARIADLEERLKEADPVLYVHTVRLLAERGVFLHTMQEELKHLPNLVAVPMQISESDEMTIEVHVTFEDGCERHFKPMYWYKLSVVTESRTSVSDLELEGSGLTETETEQVREARLLVGAAVQHSVHGVGEVTRLVGSQAEHEEMSMTTVAKKNVEALRQKGSFAAIAKRCMP